MKLIPPNIESVNTTIPGTAKFTEKVFPEDSLTQEDPTSVGFTFTKSEDPSVDRYGMSNIPSEFSKGTNTLGVISIEINYHNGLYL